jgi:hypothetical protein
MLRIDARFTSADKKEKPQQAWRQQGHSSFVDEQGQYSYAYLLRFARANRPEWFRCLCDNGTYVMKEYCKTAAFDARQAAQ